MVETNFDASISRRSILKRTAGALAVGASALAGSEAVSARAVETPRTTDRGSRGGDAGASHGRDADASHGRDADATHRGDADASHGQDAGAVHEGVACGNGHPEDSTFTVEPRCDETEGCDTILLTGLSLACAGNEKTLYADLPGTDPTVWMNPRKGEIPPGTYRVVRAERCERNAGECDGTDLYRLAFRPTDG